LQDKPPRRVIRHPKTPEFSVGTEDLIRRRKLWPVPEAAELLGVTKTTLYRWESKGYISFVRIDSRTFVADSELDRFVARAEVASEQDRSA
jgi:excisionase family DNA binding protein